MFPVNPFNSNNINILAHFIFLFPPRPRPGATLQEFEDTMKQAMMTVPKVGVCSAFMGVCDNSSIYRTADGSCNNLNNPTWGMSNTPQRRYLMPQYNDG